ncbi:MAG: GspE/PulE family protein, partial [Gemmatimonadota bacterium]
SSGRTALTGHALRVAAGSPLARLLPRRFMEEHVVLPVGEEDGRVVVARGRALDATVVDELCWAFRKPVRLVDAAAAEIQAAIMAATEEGGRAGAEDDVEVVADDAGALDDARALASQAPVIRLVNVMILEALRARASDLHLEATPDGLRVRHRIDGVLHDVSRPPRPYQAAVVSRIKIMAKLNIAERRRPQDGRIRLRLSERDVDVRVSTLPSVHGESVVLRILDRGEQVPDLTALGMPEAMLASFRRVLRQPTGIVLVTGPTGSGKTTTLYAALQDVHAPDMKLITVEDPVEYQIEGVTQVPADERAGAGFATLLRSLLRHDPDILMVGEMRDAETARVAIQSALTGHLVFSTLHTNDAPSGITRLFDMGIEPYLVAATVQAVLAQRLVRVVCHRCARPVEPAPGDLAGLEVPQEWAAQDPPARFRRGSGCDQCSGTGYQGRTGLFELMLVDDRLRSLIASGAPLDSLREAAGQAGMKPLRWDGFAKARAGATTLEEVLRVTREHDAP